MKKKSMIAFVLLIIFVLGAASAFPLSASAESAEASAAEISLYCMDEPVDVISCNVGDIITVGAYLDTSGIDGGKISGVEGYQTYSADSLTLLDELDEEELDDDVAERLFPVMGNKAMAYLDQAGSLYFVGSNLSKTNPFIFDQDNNKLIVTQYQVTSAGGSEIRTNLITLAKRDNYLTKIIDRGEVKSGYEFIFTAGLEGDSPHCLIHTDEAAPTQNADGNIEYWQCENCSAYFSDADAVNEITQEQTVINHQKIVGYTLNLKDEIGIRFYLFIPDYYSNDLSVAFSYGTGSYHREPEAALLHTAKFGANYLASCPVAARSMTDKVHMTVSAGETVILSKDYSITDYVDTASIAYADRSDLKNLLCYMLEYGAAVQTYFGYKTSGDDPDVADSYITDVYTAEEWSEIRSDAPQSITDETDMNAFDFSDYGLSFEGTKLTATASTAIRLFFKVRDAEKFADTTVTLGGKNLEFKDYNGGIYKYITISGLAAKNIFDTYTLNFSNGNNSLSAKYSAANYYNYIMENANYKANDKNAVKTMYNYSKSASEVLN